LDSEDDVYLKKLPLIGLLAVTSGFGGQIQIGGANGLTGSYVTGNCAISNCLQSPAPNGVASTNSTNTALISYTTTLFNSVSPTPNVGTGPLTDSSAQTIAAVGTSVSFNLINDGNSNDNAWQMQGSQAGNQTVDVPIGLSGIGDVFLMLNDANGVAGPSTKDAWVTFDFGASPNSTTGLTSLTVKLLDSNNSTTAAGVLQNALACTSGPSGIGNGCPLNGTSQEDNGPTLTGPVTNLVEALATNASLTTAGTSVSDYASVITNQLFSSPYSDGTTGNSVLDDLGFEFSGSLLSTLTSDGTPYLVDVRVFDNSSTSTSWDALSAITVITPEPSTWLLLLAGVSGIVVYKLRRAARHSA